MTSTTKRKHVLKEMLEDFSIPREQQQIVKVGYSSRFAEYCTVLGHYIEQIFTGAWKPRL